MFTLLSVQAHLFPHQWGGAGLSYTRRVTVRYTSPQPASLTQTDREPYGQKWGPALQNLSLVAEASVGWVPRTIWQQDGLDKAMMHLEVPH